MNANEKKSPGELWKSTSAGLKAVIGFGAFASAVMAILLLGQRGVSANDAHVNSLIDRRIAPLQDMMQFTLEKQGLWKEYQEKRVTRGCMEATMLGQNCEPKEGEKP